MNLGNYCHMSAQNEWNESVMEPVISVNLIRLFLAYIHAFTALGLESQATAFSWGSNGVIKYLALFPQYNQTDKINDIPSVFTE